MASLSSSPLAVALSSAAATSGGASFGPLHCNNKGPSFRIRRRKLVICSSSNDDDNGPGKFDRREALIGLGGLYGASTLGADPFAFAAPIDTPTFSKCTTPKDLPELPPGVPPPDCCPKPTDNISDYRPIRPAKLRVRKAAQLLDKSTLEKYKKALELMRALPDDDPRSFKQQGNVHCAYCNGSYEQLGFPLELQVHYSWLFFPFHRYYIYFYEKILGSLINDPTFGLPFWNYDAPSGMEIPKIFTDQSSSLYNPRRDQIHQPPTLIDLDYSLVEPTIDRQRQIQSNLRVMYRQVVSGARTPLLFFGRPYRAGGDPSPGMGTLENIPHNPIHLWVGDSRELNREDMGSFYSSGRDPLFYSHHSNVDRIWQIWKSLGGKRKDIQDPDYLNTSFIFYNENAEPVRVYVRDCLDITTLGYTYEDVPIPWLKSPPTPRKPVKPKKKAVAVGAALAVQRPGKVQFPLTLNKIISTEVDRPKKSRSKKEKDDEEEILVIEGIEYDAGKALKFDVFINDEDDREIRADNTEFAGSFVNVSHNGPMKMKTTLRLGITELLEELDADDDDSVVVTLVPRVECERVTIAGIRIEFEG